MRNLWCITDMSADVSPLFVWHLKILSTYFSKDQNGYRKKSRRNGKFWLELHKFPEWIETEKVIKSIEFIELSYVRVVNNYNV